MLAATDPAQPYGAALPWPKRDDGAPQARSACAGAYVVLAGAEPVALRRARRPRHRHARRRPTTRACARRSRRSPTSSPATARASSRSSASTASRSSAPLGEPARRARLPPGPAQADAQRVARPYAGRRHARGRHHPPRGEPDPPGARRARPGRDRHAPPALRQGPLARAPRRAGRGERGRARQAPVHPLRGRPRHPLAPADDGLVGRVRGGPALAALAAPRVARLPRRGPRGRAVRRPGARAHDRRSGARFDQQLAALGPDVLAPEFDRDRFLRRLREDDPTRPIGDALLDQRTVAGLGTIWRTEGCFAAAVDPWRETRRVGDDEAMAVIDAVRPRMAPQRDGRLRPRRDRDLRQSRGSPARTAARGSGQAGRARTTVGHTGAPDARRDPPDAQAHRPQGRRPHHARQHARELRRRARGRRRHGRVRRAPRAPRRLRRARARPRLRGRRARRRRSRSRRGSPTSPRTRGPASS